MEGSTLSLLGTLFGGGALLGVFYSIQQNHNNKMLSLTLEKDLLEIREENKEIKKDLKKKSSLLDGAVAQIRNLKNELNKLKRVVSNASISDIAVSKRMSVLEDRILQHQEELLEITRVSIFESSENIKDKILSRLSPEISAIKQVEYELSRLTGC